MAMKDHIERWLLAACTLLLLLALAICMRAEPPAVAVGAMRAAAPATAFAPQSPAATAAHAPCRRYSRGFAPCMHG